MTGFNTRNRKARNQARFERRERWSRSRLLATTGLGGALAGMALGGGNAWGQVGPNTLPTGGQVVAGSATINQQGQNTLNINQSTDRAVINWSSFDVGQDSTVNFYQPNSGSWTVNRVTASMAPSQILGSVNANGNIVVINPNGVIFGQGSRVDVNGIIATTSNISNQNFMSGNMTFDQAGNPTAMVVNQGDITVRDAGLVAFVAPGVSNSGTITANLGRVSLASGNKFTVDLYGDKLVSIAVGGETTAAPVDANGNPVDALVSNSGQIIADGGRVQMTAKQASQIVDNAINMSGVVRAQSAYVDQNGDIVLDAGPSGNVVVSGTLDVSGKAAGQTGGNVTVTGKNDVKLTATAKVDASGAAGGGTVKVGGDYLGQGSTPTAKRTLVATGAVIDARAIEAGDGGTVIVWSDEQTVFNGVIDARGGAISGDGGFVETSGKEYLTIGDAAIVDASAVLGDAGTWLLDPRNVTISSGMGGGTMVGDVDQFSDSPTGSVTITNGRVNTALNAGTSVVIQANEDIFVDGAINATSSAANLTMQAGRDININANITLRGNFTATANDSSAQAANHTDNSPGDFVMASGTSINTSATNGNITITVGGTDDAEWTPGNVTLRTLNAGTGNVTINADNPNTQINVNNTITAANATLTGRRIDLGANIAASGSITNGSASPVLVNVVPAADLDDAVDLVTAGGSTISFAAGTYTRATQWNVDVDDVILMGAQAGISGNDPGRTFAGASESTLNFTSGVGVNILADGVVLDGFSIRMDATSGIAVQIDDSSQTIDSPSILNNIIAGAAGSFQGAGVANTGNELSPGTISIVGNRIVGFGSSGTAGISLANVSNVYIDDLYLMGDGNANGGVDVDLADGVSISGVTVASVGVGAAVRVANANALVLSDVLLPVGASMTTGILAENLVASTISNVELHGDVSDVGIWISGGQAATVTGVTIDGSNLVGVAFDDAISYDNRLSDATISNSTAFGVRLSTSVAFDSNLYLANVSVSGAGNSGILVSSSGAGTSYIYFDGGNYINHGANTGLLLTGVGAAFVDPNVGLGDTTFVSDGIGNAASKYVVYESGAGNGLVVNGLNATFDGVSGATNPAVIAQIEAKITDDETLATFDDIFVAGAVTLVSGDGIDGIQNALDIYDNFDFAGTVNLTGGTYNPGTVDELEIDQDGVTLQALDATPVNIVFDADAINGLTVFGANVTVTGLHLDMTAGVGGNIVLVDTGADNFVLDGNTLTGGVDVTNGIALFANGAVIANNVINGATATGDGILVDSVAGTITGLTIDNNTITDFGGDGLYVDPVFGSTVTNNVIIGVGDNGIFIDTPIGNVLVSGNSVDDTGLDGIRIENATGIVSDTIQVIDNEVGTSLDAIGGSGIVLTGNSGFLGTTAITGNNVSVNVDGTRGIQLVAVRSSNVSNNTVTNTGAADYGLEIVGTGVTVSNHTVSAAGTDGNVFDGFDVAGIRVQDTDAFNVNTATVILFSGPNTINIGAGADGLQVDGAGTRIGTTIPTRTLGEMTFLRSNVADQFIVLSNDALFSGPPAPTTPTLISAGDAFFDIDANGVIDGTDLDLQDFNPANIDTQAELDAFWAAGGVAAGAADVEAAIIDNSDDGTLGRISVLGAAVTIVDDPLVGLEGVQAAIDATPTGGYVFISEGVYGANPPGGIGSSDPLTIGKSLNVYGRQAFVDANDPGRTAGGANETVFDFSDVDVDTDGAVVINANNVTLRGVDIVADGVSEVYGIQIQGSNRAGIVIANNFIHGVDDISTFLGNGIETTGNLASATITGNQIYNVAESGILIDVAPGATEFTLNGNSISAGSSASAVGILITALGNATTLTMMDNTIGNAGSDAIQANNFNIAIIQNNVIDSTLVGAAVGRDAIRVSGGSAGSMVSDNQIGGTAGFTVGANGINLVGPTGSFAVENNTISNVAFSVADSAGIRIQGISGTPTVLVQNNTIGTVSSAGSDGIAVVNGSASNVNVSLVGNSIGTINDAGISVIDNSAAINSGITTVIFGAGNIVDDAGRGLFFSGPDTRSQDGLGNRTFSDLVLGSSAASITGNYIELQNAALHGNPNGTPFDPLTYDASGVTFNGLDVTTLDPTVLADRQDLADLESRIVHYLDTTAADFGPDVLPPNTVRNMRGLIRLKTDSFSLDDSSGLNAIQLAISASNDFDTIYLVAGSYGDQSDLLGTINDQLQGVPFGTAGNDYLYIDRPISIIGVNNGVGTTSRLPFTPANESVLDFVAATSSGDGGVVIGSSDVVIDGVTVLADGDQPFGIRIDTLLAGGNISNITLVNNFVLGDGIGSEIAGNGIESTGDNSITNLTVSGNAIDFVTGNGIILDDVTGLRIQNNLIGSQAGTDVTVALDGIHVEDSTYATSVSGNSIYDTGGDGIDLNNSGLAANGATNFVSVVDNTFDNIGETGILVDAFRTVAIVNNTIGLNAQGIGDSGIFVSNTDERVTITGNIINNVGTDGATDAAGIGVTITSGTGLAATDDAVSIADNTITDNVATDTGLGIFVGGTANGTVQVIGNTISGIDTNHGIFIWQTTTGNVFGTNNTIDTTGDVGFWVDDTGGSVTLTDNTANNTGEDGLLVTDTTGGVRATGNVVGNSGSIGTDSTIADAIQILDTGGNVTVDDNTIASGADVDRDGIRIFRTTGNVSVFNNSIGTGGNLDTGDGIHIRDTGLTVSVSGNSVNNAGDDGIAIVNVGLSVEVVDNIVFNVGFDSDGGDGILVTNTGTVGVDGDLNGTVRVLGNDISDVFGDGTADADDGRSRGDGIRVSEIDGDAILGNDGNTIVDADDDGIEAYMVNGNVSSSNNTITNVSQSTSTGDGIAIAYVGLAYTGAGLDNANVAVINNTITNSDGTGVADTLADGLSAGDGIRISNIDGIVTVSGNSIVDVGNDGIQLWNINGASTIVGNTVSLASQLSNTGDGIVVENTGGLFASDADTDEDGSVLIISNTVVDVFGSAALDTDTISGGVSLSAGDGIRVGAIDGDVQIGQDSLTGNSVDTTAGDGIQAFNVTGNGANAFAVLLSHNTVTVAGNAGTDGDGIVVSNTGQFAGSGTNFSGGVIARNNVVNDVFGVALDRDDGLTAGDGLRLSNVDGTVQVLDNSIAIDVGVSNDGIQVRNVSQSVTVDSNTLGTGPLSVRISVDTDDGDGIVVESTGTLSTAGHAVAGDGDVTITDNFVAGVANAAAIDRDGAAVTVTGLNPSLSAGDGIRVGYADGDVRVGDATGNGNGNTVTGAYGDGIQVFAVTGNGGAVGGPAVYVSDNIVNSIGNGTTDSDGIVVSFTGGFVTNPGTSIVNGNGGVDIVDNTVDLVTGIGIDRDDGRTAGDAVRVRSADGDVTVSTNLIATESLSLIFNDGVQIWDVTEGVTVDGNTIGTGGGSAIGAAAAGLGDGIVIENTGQYSTKGVTNFAGSVTVTDNVVRNVMGNAAIDLDGGTLDPSAISADNDPNQFLSSGDGIRTAFISGSSLIDNNEVTNVAGDGIQAYFVQGVADDANAVEITDNRVSSVGNGGPDGDGIVVSFTGAYGNSALAPTIGFGDVLIDNNEVNGVNGNGIDRDDSVSAGDGIRVRSAAGSVTISNNEVGVSNSVGLDSIDNDGIPVPQNTVGGGAGGTIGTGGSGDGDGIVVENTGLFTTGGASYTTSGEGDVLVTLNTVSNVVGDGTDDADGVTAGGVITGSANNDPDELLTAGDGIRVGFVNGDVTIGGDSTTGNTVNNVGDDGIQVYAVDGIGGAAGGPAVLITDNRVSLTGAVGTAGDGIVVSYTGLFVSNAGGISAGTDGLVRILDNTVDDVGGNGADDDDDRSAGDGIRVRSADTGVEIDGNSIATQAGGTIANDGIQVWDVTGSVTVNENTVGTAATIGTGASGNGDGIAVENVGGQYSSRLIGPEGNVYVTDNVVRNVGGEANTDADGANLNFAGFGPEADPIQFLSSGDGVRVGFVSGQASITGNLIDNTTNDGIQAYAVQNVSANPIAVSIVDNTVTNVGNGTVGGQRDGDGIVVSYTGDLTGSSNSGSNGGVLIDANRVDDVSADIQFDRDDGRTAGDGIRVRSADGVVTISNNLIATNASSIANDGIQVWDATGNIIVTSNTIGGVGSSIGAETDDGDGIVVENTGTIGASGTTLATAGSGGVTVIDNTISNVVGGALDDRDGVVAAVSASESNASAGDGIRVAFADGDVLIHNNDVVNVADDGIQVLSVTGNGPNGGTTTLAGVTITDNVVTSVGAGTGLGDGIVVSFTGIVDIGSAAMTGGVLVNGNVVNTVVGDGTDDDDDFTAGDGIRVVGIDGDVTVSDNTIATAGDTAAAGNIANDGIQIMAVGKTVRVLDNVLGQGASIGTGASGDGDGIVIVGTGTLAGGFGVDGGGAVTVQGNTVSNVVGGGAGPDLDDGYSSGDGLRIAYADGNVLVDTNTFTNIGDDGVQIDQVRGTVVVTANSIGSVGNVSLVGDGIVVSNVGVEYAGGTAAGGVTVDGNFIDNVDGDGLGDPDDMNHSNGDGIRVVYVDGPVQTNANTITNVDDDGIYIAVVKGAVNVRNNFLNTIGRDSATGDGIVVSHTGSIASSLAGAGAGAVTILNNTIQNVNADSPASFDFDDPDAFFNGKSLSAGDGIRAEYIDGPLVIGDSSTTGNSILNVDDDGIQVESVRGNATILYNRIATVGIDGNKGDGIIVENVGAAYASGGPAGVTVTVGNNTITGVNGDGLGDPDDSAFSAGDGVRIVNVDGNVRATTNTVGVTDDDGIYIGVVRGTTNVLDNRVDSVGNDSATGDGIVVAATGTFVGGAESAGDVTVLNNTVTNVNASAPATPDYDDPNGAYAGIDNGYSAGDGIRVETIDGDVVVGNSATTGNSVGGTDDDGIQIVMVRGNVTAQFNRIATVGIDGDLGDGIVVQDVGMMFAGGNVGGNVSVDSNTITGVNGDGLADPNDANHSNGDGIRIVRVDGNSQSNSNTIASVDDDGIYHGVIKGTVNVNSNRLNSIGLDSATGDGIVVSLTGEYAGGTADSGSVTINGNSIANVDAGSAGLNDFDNPNGFYGGTGAGLSAGDGIRVEMADGQVVVGLGAGTGNSIQNVDDDGIQVYSVTGATTIGFNTIANVANDGADSITGDGIQVNLTGAYATLGYGAQGAGDVVVLSNHVTNVQNDDAQGVAATPDFEDAQSSGDGIRLHDISGDATVNSNVIDPIEDDGIQIGNVDFSVTSNFNTITDVGFVSLTGDGIVVFNTGLVGANDANGNVTVSGNVITNVGIGAGGVGDADPDDGGFTSNDGIRISTVDGSVVSSNNSIANTRDDGIQIINIERTVTANGNSISTVGAGSMIGDGIVVSNTGSNYAPVSVGSGSVTVSGNSISNVTGDGTLDADDVVTAGDGVRVSATDSVVVIANNVVQNVGDDGIQAFSILGDVSVTSNQVTVAGALSTTGDGIVVEEVGNGNVVVVVSSNTIADVRGDGNVANVDSGGLTTENDGIRVEDVSSTTISVANNMIVDVGDDGVEVSLFNGDAFVTGNSANSIGTGSGGLGDGIIVDSRGLGNGATVSGNTVTNVLSVNGGSADNVDGYTAGDGIRVSNMPLNVMVSDNTVTNAADDGVQTKFNGGNLVITGNRIDSVSNVSSTGDGVDVTEHAGNMTVSNNVITRVFGDGTLDPDGSGLSSGDGIRVEQSTGFLIANGNSIGNVGDDGIQVEDLPNSVTANNNVIADFGNLTAGSGDGIVISDTTGSVTASGNDISDGNGTAADIDDPAYMGGDAIRIVRTSIDVTTNDNDVDNVADNGIEIDDTGGDVNASGNALSNVDQTVITITDSVGDVTVASNSLTNNGDGDAADTGIFLEDFASAVVTANTIMNVTPGSLGIGVDIGNDTSPLALITLTDNVLNDSGTGLFIRDNVMGTVTGNFFQNNVVWGVQIDNGVSGNGIGVGEPGDAVPTIDILFRSNTIAGNGVGAVTPGVTGGGINNLRPGPGVGGFIFDARMNDFSGQTPFTTGTHFEAPNSGGTGDAVSDWVRIDLIAAPLTPVVIPYYSFGSLLDNFARGGDAETPGDVLAFGPSFDQNGNLFDPFFVDVFRTAFGLSGDPAAQSAATEYAMCYLANMWKPSSCRKAPPAGN